MSWGQGERKSTARHMVDVFLTGEGEARGERSLAALKNTPREIIVNQPGKVSGGPSMTC